MLYSIIHWENHNAFIEKGENICKHINRVLLISCQMKNGGKNMCYYIGIEDLAANALIEIVEKTGKRSVNFSQLSKYGNVILMNLKKNNTDVKLIFNREATNQFFHDCSDIFTIEESEDDIIISLNDNISTTYLRSRFRINIALQLIKAFVSQEAIKVLVGELNEKN